MAQTIDTSLEARLADLESSVRALRTADPFGQLTAADTATVELWGTANAGPGQAGWAAGAPSVTLFVASGRLRVDVAAALVAAGNKCSAYMSWAVLGPASRAEDAPFAVQAVGPDFTRAIEVQHGHSGQDQRAAASTFGLHTDLAVGWYTVAARYAITYSGTSYAPYGAISNRRLTVMPY